MDYLRSLFERLPEIVLVGIGMAAALSLLMRYVVGFGATSAATALFRRNDADWRQGAVAAWSLKVARSTKLDQASRAGMVFVGAGCLIFGAGLGWGFHTEAADLIKRVSEMLTKL